VEIEVTIANRLLTAVPDCPAVEKGRYRLVSVFVPCPFVLGKKKSGGKPAFLTALGQRFESRL
jgi:hypothetical protein